MERCYIVIQIHIKELVSDKWSKTHRRRLEATGGPLKADHHNSLQIPFVRRQLGFIASLKTRGVV
jgi:hypothetical protein